VATNQYAQGGSPVWGTVSVESVDGVVTISPSGIFTVQLGGTSIVQVDNTVTVSPTGVSTVSIAGTPAVTISGTQTVSPTGITTVSVAGTPTVVVSSAPTTAVTGTFFQATQPVSIASMPSTPVTGTFWQATQPVSGTVTAIPATSFGKTITFVSVAQGGAGTTELAAASASNKHKLMGACLVGDAAGTVSFTDGTATLCGAMSIAANAGFVLPTGFVPYTETAATNRPLNLVTATAKVSGMVAILTEP